MPKTTSTKIGKVLQAEYHFDYRQAQLNRFAVDNANPKDAVMNLNDLLRSKNIDPALVLVLRHRPEEPQLNKVLPWLMAELPDLFNAYQQTQGDKLERVMQAMVGIGYIASFIRYEAGKALFVGLYSIERAKPLAYAEYWAIPENVELKEKYGMRGFTGEKRSSLLWFDLKLQSDFYADWKGKLIVGWPPPERSWWRRAHRPANDMPVLAILEDAAFERDIPEWDALNLTWDELQILPKRLKEALSHWRGVYYIFDTSDGKGYVGSAYGKDNLLGRWLDYATSGDGGNRLLKRRDPRKFIFTILQRVSPDIDDNELIRLENSWKQRLHSRPPFGLNDN
jgi:hypothetical protein